MGNDNDQNSKKDTKSQYKIAETVTASSAKREKPRDNDSPDSK